MKKYHVKINNRYTQNRINVADFDEINTFYLPVEDAIPGAWGEIKFNFGE